MMSRNYKLFVCALCALSSQSTALLSTAKHPQPLLKISQSNRRQVSLASTTIIQAPTETITTESQVIIKKKHIDVKTTNPMDGPAEMWEVRLYDDPVNYMEYVASTLVKVTGISELHAYRTMKQAHEKGEATVGEYDWERAEYYKATLQQKQLAVDIFPLDFQ